MALHLFFGKPHSLERVMRFFGGNTEFSLLVGSFLISTAASVCNPHPATRLHNRFECRYHTACRYRPLSTVFIFMVNVWLTVGYDKNLPVSQVCLNKLLQAFRRPGRVELLQAHTRFLARGKPRLRETGMHLRDFIR